MYVAEVEDEIFVLDCGLQYPENELLGIDVVIPDFTYLEENSERIAGVFLTHGHADAIGALPYLLSKIQVPVFGTELTIELAKLSVNSHAETKKFKDFHVIDPHTEIDFGQATVSFFKTTHTIPDSIGVSIKTKEGNIVYTGDFKFDQSAIMAAWLKLGKKASWRYLVIHQMLKTQPKLHRKPKSLMKCSTRFAIGKDESSWHVWQVICNGSNKY